MHMPDLSNKLHEIRQELRRLGLWQPHIPPWLSQYEAMPECSGVAFPAWLQFVYLPGKSFHGQHSAAYFIAPQAMAFLEEVPDKGRLLQLLIELDALI